jgi:hypothetical protein
MIDQLSERVYELKIEDSNGFTNAAVLYKECKQLEETVAELLKVLRAKTQAAMEDYLAETGDSKVKTVAGTINLISYKPKMVLDEQAWTTAVIKDPALETLVVKIGFLQENLKNAQKKFLVEKEQPKQLRFA